MPTPPAAAELGPVDVAVLLFEDSNFNGDVGPALLDVHRSGTIRILDLAFITKDLDGEIAYLELEDVGVEHVLAELIPEEIDLLSDEDLTEAAAGLDPGASALVIVWANTWSARLSSAIRASGGELIALERIPYVVVEAAIAAVAEEEN